MLGIGWTEMLVIGVVALIFIGPKDLPIVMARAGKIIGQIQRMGREFQREINKTTGLDEVRNLRSSITAPLKKTADEIRKEFNAIGADGKQHPTGVIKPADPNVESVADEIREKAGMPPVKKSNDQIAAEAGFKPAVKKPLSYTEMAAAKAETEAATKAAEAKPRTRKSTTAKPATAKAATAKATKSEPVKAAKAASTKPAKAAPAKAAESAAPAPVAAKKPARAPRTKAAEAAEPTTKPAAKPKAPRKKPAETAEKS